MDYSRFDNIGDSDSDEQAPIDPGAPTDGIDFGYTGEFNPFGSLEEKDNALKMLFGKFGSGFQITDSRFRV